MKPIIYQSQTCFTLISDGIYVNWSIYPAESKWKPLQGHEQLITYLLTERLDHHKWNKYIGLLKRTCP